MTGIIDNGELTYNINLLDLPLKYYGNIHFHSEHEVARGQFESWKESGIA